MLAGEEERACLGRAQCLARSFHREQGGEAGELAGRETRIGAAGERIVRPACPPDPAIGRGKAGEDSARGEGEALRKHRRIDRGGGIDLTAAEKITKRGRPRSGCERLRLPDLGKFARRPQTTAESDRAAPG